ncbi:MarR family winged helix-turn-helix transcriptional regulator [Photobacterium kasasachensis]|uniref:MarR family winged helix-turn-helix transcriptional regulator n=1 Tax=Photobacterium kasasachensis TaxID=2910240 RepID=UPI003D096218
MANKKAIIDADMSIESKVIGLITCIGQEYKSEMARRLAPMNLSMTQLNILHALSFAPDHCLTVNQIKQAMIDDSPNVSRALNKLMDAGLIEKQRSTQDQRIVHIHLTAEGAQAHVDADKQLLDMNVEGLTKDEVEQLFDLIKKI